MLSRQPLNILRVHLSLSIIKSAIAANNAEYRMRAVIALFMGIATSLLVYITLIGIFFITMVTGPWLLYASVLFGFFFLLGLFQARKSDYDPLSGIAPPSELENKSARYSRVFLGVGISPRHAVLGIITMVFHGPMCIVRSIGLFRSLLSGSPRLAVEAADLFDQLQSASELPLPEPLSPPAKLLCTLGLAKVRPPVRGRPGALTLSQKAISRLVASA